jgi:hypothetical protein
MRRRDAVAFVPWTVEIATIAALFRDAALVVAMRLHAAVVAEAFGTPTVVLPYDRKLGELARQRGLATLDATALDALATTRACLEDTILGRAGGRGVEAGEVPPHDWLAIDFAGVPEPAGRPA